jgi:adenine/guanine phosphoribosyltransferase-like PRPP-binding protein
MNNKNRDIFSGKKKSIRIIVCMALGLSIGLILGIMTNNFILGISVGLALGVGFLV